MAITPDKVRSKRDDDEQKEKAKAEAWAREQEGHVDTQLAASGYPCTVEIARGTGTPRQRDALAAVYRAAGWRCAWRAEGLHIEGPEAEIAKTERAQREREAEDARARDYQDRDYGDSGWGRRSSTGASGPLPPPELPHAVAVVAALAGAPRGH
jgi:hypothetical protein